VFLGEYQHSVDPKGRVVMPAKFRHGLADGVVVTKGQEHCLYVFPAARWEEEVLRLSRLPRTNRRNRNYTRSLFGGASDQELDRQGRIQVPAPLRTYAGLDKEVVVVGVADHVEIWDAAGWSRVSAEADESYAEIEEALGEEGI
jgi:MraZ protein